jgi:serine/threonine protein kinase
MDPARAKRFAKELIGETVSGWSILECINWGKSAVVFKAQKDTQLAAVKFFDPELVERYGLEVQSQRIDREKSLIGKKHPNLVEIFDGGYWKEKELFYIVMEFLPWKNLAEVLTDVPIGRERPLIAQIASATRFLEGLDVCHRDIKPENIAVSPDFQTAKLLDLGVIKPQGSKPITDEIAKNFIGTVKYSPPEFLLREEENNLEGWRAVTFYHVVG